MLRTISDLLPRLPAPRIAPAVEAGDYHDSLPLNFEEYCVGKAAHSRTATVPVDDSELQWISRDCLPWPRPPTRNAAQAADGCCHTMPARPAGPHSLQVSRRPGASRFLKKARPDLLPREDIGRVLLMPSDAVLKLRPLRIRQRCRVRFQALPDRIQQFCLLGWGQAIDLASQIVHTFINLARFPGVGKSRRFAGVSEAGARHKTIWGVKFES